jgi:electron transfer flavoprotein-quinone oxidoreductase
MSEVAEPDFDVIVVGAGIAGCVTAYQLAQQGRSVLLIERGEAPGAKNLSGGVLYSRGIQEVFPGFLDEAPVERRITRNCVTFLNATSSVGLDYQDARLADPVNAVTVLRAKLDPWLAAKCEEAGVTVMPGVRVDRVLTEDGPATNAGVPAASAGGRAASWHANGTNGTTGRQVVGVQAGEDELRAHVVVAADGVNSFLARDAGLRPKDPLNHLAVGVKSVVSLPRETIEARFNLTGDEGAAIAVVGDCTEGVGGGGFLYTNTDSVSVGVVVRLDDLTAQKKVVTDIFDHFLAHRFIAPYLEGGELAEYGCHLVAEGGLKMIGEITMDGMVVVGDAAGLTLNTGLTVRGMDLAVASAIAAAEGIGAALENKDTSKAGLAGYRERFFASYAGQDMKTYAKAPAFLEQERMYKQYGELFADVLYGAFSLDTRPRRHLLSVARRALAHSPLKMRHLVSDGIAGGRAL